MVDTEQGWEISVTPLGKEKIKDEASKAGFTGGCVAAVDLRPVGVSLLKANPGCGCPRASEQPGQGKEACRGTHHCSAHSSSQGMQGKQEGAQRLPVFVL